MHLAGAARMTPAHASQAAKPPQVISGNRAPGVVGRRGNATELERKRRSGTIAVMTSDLDPGALDPDFAYLLIQLRHIGVSLGEMDAPAEPLDDGRCHHSGLTIPECSCESCTRELILRYRPKPGY